MAGAKLEIIYTPLLSATDPMFVDRIWMLDPSSSIWLSAAFIVPRILPVWAETKCTIEKIIIIGEHIFRI